MRDVQDHQGTDREAAEKVAPDVVRVQHDVLIKAAEKVARRRAELFERLSR